MVDAVGTVNLSGATIAATAYTPPPPPTGSASLFLNGVGISSTASVPPVASANIVLGGVTIASNNYTAAGTIQLAGIGITATGGPVTGNKGVLNYLLQDFVSTGTGGASTFQDNKIMTKLRAIIQDALRESNLIPLGAAPESEEHDEALRLLNRVIFALFGNELGDDLCTLNYKDGFQFADTNTLPPNIRLFINPLEDKVFKLNPWPEDGERFSLTGNIAPKTVTIEGNGHKINGADSVSFNGATVSVDWFFRADIGQWVRVVPLGDNDDSPFPVEFDDLLITKLSMRLDPRYGRTMTPETVEAMKEIQTKFRARYKQTRQAMSEWPLRDIGPDDGSYFDRGYGFLNYANIL